ncbi:probable small intestine urate exporter isoform X2 [Sorex fumeus]|uniref:probable small intestine urate exporter isoform X2 n=1 Tax=Sorex fumeus TaxID=62283 RepID=UPI0024AD351E|nr:probable small intestine urate exporter isoform X2 [Sorex fumeus]
MKKSDHLVGCFSVRYMLAFILLLCNFSVLTQNMSLNIAIPAMVNITALPSSPNTSTEGPPIVSKDNWNETQKEIMAMAPVYDWSPEIQGIILSSINYGSFLTPIPSGYIAGIFGAKYVVGAGIFISSVLSLFIPLAADTGVALIIIIRIIQGIAQVSVSTGQYSIWIKWGPPLERNKLIAIANSGSLLGYIIILLTGGVLCQTVGWSYIFYIFGGVGCVCSFTWFSLFSEKPRNHPFISTAEKEYIESSLAQEDGPPGWSVPIKAMLKSIPLWVILICIFCEYWQFHVLIVYLPTYINSVLQADLKTSGFLSALPFVFGLVFIILEGQLADFLLSRKLLKLNTIRKLFTAIGVLFSSPFLLSLYWVRSSHSTTMAFFVLSAIFSSFNELGVLINVIDIAPRYVSFLKGVSEVFSNMVGAISPAVSGYLISQDSEFGWRNVFFLSTAINIVGLIFYVIFGQAEIQDWAREDTFTRF